VHLAALAAGHQRVAEIDQAAATTNGKKIVCSGPPWGHLGALFEDRARPHLRALPIAAPSRNTAPLK
jgi:hypothetical protein